MFQVRIHGLDGQGVVTSAELRLMVAFDHGRHAQVFPRFAQVFPSFASERTGAPVVGFCGTEP